MSQISTFLDLVFASPGYILKGEKTPVSQRKASKWQEVCEHWNKEVEKPKPGYDQSLRTARGPVLGLDPGDSPMCWS